MSLRGTLVVGASGVLAPAAAILARRGETVTGIARRRPVPAGVEALVVDARDATALAAAVGRRRWSRCIVYEPAISEESFAVLASVIDGPVVRVRTSAVADPARGKLVIPPATLQLGWHDEAGEVRWHTANEISDAALQVTMDGMARTLGTLRPWDRRP